VSGQASLSTQAFKQKVRCLGVIAWLSTEAVAPPDDTALSTCGDFVFGRRLSPDASRFGTIVKLERSRSVGATKTAVAIVRHRTMSSKNDPSCVSDRATARPLDRFASRV
jgi:hypothetical protein